MEWIHLLAFPPFYAVVVLVVTLPSQRFRQYFIFYGVGIVLIGTFGCRLTGLECWIENGSHFKAFMSSVTAYNRNNQLAAKQLAVVKKHPP